MKPYIMRYMTTTEENTEDERMIVWSMIPFDSFEIITKDDQSCIDDNGYMSIGEVALGDYECVVFDEEKYFKACGEYEPRVRIAIRDYRLKDILE